MAPLSPAQIGLGAGDPFLDQLQGVARLRKDVTVSMLTKRIVFRSRG